MGWVIAVLVILALLIVVWRADRRAANRARSTDTTASLSDADTPERTC